MYWGAESRSLAPMNSMCLLPGGRSLAQQCTAPRATAWGSSPVLGFVTDKINRVTGLAIGSLLGALGYSSMWFVTDPDDPTFLPLFILLGIGQTACNLSAQALVGQEAPEEARGVVIGGFGFAGTLGIIFSTWIGGVIFDLWMPSAPFVFVGGLTWLVFFYALVIRRVAPIE